MKIKVTRQAIIRSLDEPGGDFIERNFRLTSAGYVDQDHLDISEEVLQAALPLFQPGVDAAGKQAFLLVLADHRREAGQWLGQVREATWMEASDRLPAGIDGLIRLYRTSDPRIVNGVEAGVLTAVSISFDAEGHPSHDLPDFEQRLGETHDDGTIIRIIIDRITAIYEVSIVWMGADPTALSLDRSFSDAPDTTEPVTPRVAEGDNFMDELLKSLIEKLGLDPAATAEECLATIQALLDGKAEAEKSAGDSEVVAEEARAGKAEAERALAGLKAEILIDRHGIQGEQRAALIEQASRSYDAVKLALESVPRAAAPVAPAGEIAPNTVADVAVKPTLTDAQRAVCAQLGISEEQFLRTVK